MYTSSLLVTLGHILFGGYFLYSGIMHFAKNAMMAGYAGSKGVPSPSLAVYVSGAMIILGGFGVLTQIYVTESLSLIVIFLIPVTLKMHQFWKESDPMMKMGEMTNFLKNTALLGAALSMM